MSHIEFAAKVQTFIANLQILSDAKDAKLDKNAQNNSFGECMHDNKL